MNTHTHTHIHTHTYTHIRAYTQIHRKRTFAAEITFPDVLS